MENKTVYEPGKFTFKMFEDLVNSLQKQKESRNVIRYVGRSQLEIEKLIGDEEPKSKKRLEEIYSEIDKETKESHWKNAALFIEKYGKELYAFCDNISNKDCFLSYTEGEYLWWNAIETGEIDEDDDFLIVLKKGVFSYVKSIAGGYAGKEVIEEDITKERVLELLKK